MKFFCEYCGNRIDADKDTKCPNCGASYKKNATFLRYEEEKKNKEKKAEEVFEQTRKNINAGTKVFFIIFIAIFGIVFISIITGIIGMSCLGSKAVSTLPDIIDSQVNDKDDEKVTVGINEYGKTSKYQVKVTGYNKETNYFYHPKEGYEYITFNLVVENLSSESISHEDVNCIVDGVAQTNYRSSGYSTLPFFIKSNLAVKGDATFEVPIDATSYDIRYGDYVTIHIEK